MFCRVLTATALLVACTPDRPTAPPDTGPDVQDPRRAPAAPDPAPPRPPPAGNPTPAVAPAVGDPAPSGAREDPVHLLAPPPGRDGLPGPRGGAGTGCEGGARRFGETWKVDCNECACGDDGQVTCTAMACNYR